MITPDGSAAGVAAGYPQSSNRGIGRKRCQAPNRTAHHLAANHVDWATEMVGWALYRNTLMILRNRGKDSNGSKINSRKWVGGECGIQIGGNGEDWKTISASHWRLHLHDAFVAHVPVSPFEIYEILMGYTRLLDPGKKMGIASTGQAGVAAMSVMAETIEGIVGGLAIVEANPALAGRGVLTELPVPNYGYARSMVVLHARIENSLYNDWVYGNPDDWCMWIDKGGNQRT